MRYTRVTTNDSVDILVPNSEFINSRVTNWTFGERSRRIRVPFGVAYGSDKTQVREAGLAAAKRVQGLIIDDQHPANVLLVALGESSLDFALTVWVGPDLIAKPGGTTSKLLWALEEELNQRGIEIPYPQRDLRIRSGPFFGSRRDQLGLEQPAPDDGQPRHEPAQQPNAVNAGP